MMAVGFVYLVGFESHEGTSLLNNGSSLRKTATSFFHSTFVSCSHVSIKKKESKEY